MEVIAKTYSPGLQLTTYWGIDPDDILRLLNGTTTILLKCKDCGYIRKERMAGEEVK